MCGVRGDLAKEQDQSLSKGTGNYSHREGKMLDLTAPGLVLDRKVGRLRGLQLGDHVLSMEPRNSGKDPNEKGARKGYCPEERTAESTSVAATEGGGVGQG